jgi:hypothetical protein
MMNGHTQEEISRVFPVAQSSSGNTGKVLLSIIKREKAEHGFFTLQKLNHLLPAVSKHSLGGHIGRLVRDGFLFKQEGKKDTYQFTSKSLDEVKLRMKAINNMSVDVKNEKILLEESIFKRIPVVTSIPETVAPSPVEASSLPVEADNAALAMAGVRPTMKGIAERLLELAMEAETVLPNLTLISNEELFAELHRRMK